MKGLSERFTQLLAKVPMAVVVIPFAIGIFFAEVVVLPLWLALLACVVALAGVIFLTKWWQSVALAVMILTVGVLLHTFSHRGEIPYNTPVDIEIKLETSSAMREGYTSAEAKILASTERALTGCGVVLWGDSLTQFKAGDRLRLSTQIHPFRTEREEYARLMHHRGFIGSVAVGQRTAYDYIPAEEESLHDKAVARLRLALPEGDARSVVLAMVTGERGEIESELRQSYSASGASHLLAVSGLHIGIVFMLVNLLLLPLILLRHGDVVRSIFAVAMIWGYVWMCGMSPSAIRAAIMFSLLQFSLASLRSYASLNILSATAFLMLAFDTHLLFDISFQLSFIAVGGIIVWAMPIYKLCATRSWVANTIIGVLTVGIASTLATLPLVAHAFRVVAVVGILINPLVILLANAVVITGVAAMGVPGLGGVANHIAEWQNRMVAWAAELPYGHFDIALAEWVVWCIYALFIATSFAVAIAPKRKKEIKIEG